MKEPQQKLASAPRDRERAWTGWSVLYLALGLLPWLAMAAILLSRLGYAAADLRQLALAPMGADETWIVNEVERTLGLGKPLIMHLYPDLYFLAAWVPLYVWKTVHSVTTTDVIMCLRLVSLLCFVMVGVFSTLGVARLRGSRDGFLFSLLFFVLCVSPELVMRSTACQPDLMNLCVFTALFLCGMGLVRKPVASVVALCGVVAGMGMAVKFSTVLVLPALALVVGLHAFSFDRDRLWLYARQSARVSRWIVSAGIVWLVLLSAVAWMASRHGSSLGWLPVSAGVSSAAGMTVYIMGALVLLAALWAENRLEKPSARSVCVVWFLGHNGLLLGLAFVAAFYLCAPNQWFHLRFLSEIGASAGMTTVAVGAASSFIKFNLATVVHPALLALAVVGAVVAIGSCWTGRKKALVADEVLALAWAVIVIAYLVFRVARTRERYVYPALPALVCLAWFTVHWGIGLLERVRFTSQWVATAVVVGLMGAQCFVQARERARNTEGFIALDKLNGSEVGRWLLSNVPHEVPILCSAGAHIPLAFSKVHGLGMGDPFDHLKQSRPGFIVLGDAMKAHAAAVPEGGFDEIYLVPGTRSRQFYAALDNGSLGFHRLREFRSLKGPGFVVYKRDGTFPVELKTP
ncbi:MAG: hypothetical protein NT105_21005 [Verrucomicrobia bacterium]|nr:hypothetical protein [Verrucomicrobiota bacterium]